MDIETANAVKLFFPNPSLVQVFFEALANSLDADATEISIKIEIERFTAPDTLRVTVIDNGNGFTDESFERFSQLLNPQDPFHKGLGRLVFLKYFDRVEIDSRWEGHHRTFVFDEKFKGQDILSTTDDSDTRQTKLMFSRFCGERVKSYEYLKPGALKEQIIEHFLPTLIFRKRNGKDFKIHLELETEDGQEQKDFLSSDETITPDDLPELKSVEIKDPTVDAFDGVEMLYDVRKPHGTRKLTIAANIDGRTIPINLLQANSVPPEYSVTCLFYSKLFDGKADTARQKIELPDSVPETEFYRLLRRELGKVLATEIPQISERNTETKEKFEEKFPHLLGYFEETTVGLIDKDDALNQAQQRFFKTQKTVLQCEALDDETYEKSLELSSRTLTEYILYRDKIIRRMKEMTKSNSEAEIHNLIVPRYAEFQQEGLVEEAYRNNAWLLDDRFMSFQTILSEGQMDSVIEAITLEDSPIKDEGRPDITMIFSGDPKEIPAVDVVVVELKKITDDEKDNQFVINQLLSRARKLAAHCPNIENIWYYAVIHINSEMEEVLLQQEFVPMFSKGRVFYKEFPTRRPDGSIVPTPTVIMSFDAIVADAESRNHTFLEILRSSMRRHAEEQNFDS